MFKQSDRIRDYVFPLCIAEKKEEGIEFKKFLGSGFLIGNNSFAITAAPVIDEVDGDIFALFIDEDNQWLAFDISESEIHAEEDVALIKVNYQPLHSFFCLNNAFETQSLEYKQFAYPDDMMYELEDFGRATGRPDMIYLQGYIRRRTNHPIPNMRGKSFFQLSQIGGTGCSGSPIFKIDQSKNWKVVGVYVGERLNDRGTSVAYAVREDAIRDWAPTILGHTLLVEALRSQFSGEQGVSNSKWENRMDVYPPPILYKFISLSKIISGRINKSGEPFRGIDSVREMIIEENIWYSKPADFNDPFEFQNIKCVGLKNQPLATKQINKLNSSDGDSVLSRCGIICFCNNSKDIRMWSHYAEGHKGICISFKCEKSPFYDHKLYDITYEDNIIEYEIDLTDMDNDLLLRQVSTKAKCWQYEEEYRLINPPTSLYDSDGYGLKPFPSNLIEGIIFGLKTSDEHKREIKNIIGQVDRQINLYQAFQVEGQLKLKIVKCE